MAVAAILLTVPLFWVGMTLQRRTQSRLLRFVFALLGIVVAVPGFLLVAYYTHLFDSAHDGSTLSAHRASAKSVCVGLDGFAGSSTPGSIPRHRVESCFGQQRSSPWLAAVSSNLYSTQLISTNSRIAVRGGVCLQTTYSTCGPASSASLLQAFGQDASEQQLARESFTSKGGTEIWYLARAFRRRGFRTNFVIQSPDHIFSPVHL